MYYKNMEMLDEDLKRKSPNGYELPTCYPYKFWDRFNFKWLESTELMQNGKLEFFVVGFKEDVYCGGFMDGILEERDQAMVSQV